MKATLSTLLPAQLADRQKGIGGSDCAVALGLSEWKTAYQLYLEKRGELAPEDLSDREPVEWGVRLESAVRQKYADETGRAVALPEATVFHPKIPWLFCHPDGVVLEDRRLVSVKTADSHTAHKWGEPGSSDVPQEYYLQAQHEMIVMSAVTGSPWIVCDLPVLIGGNRWRLYEIGADEETQTMILSGLTEFMDGVAKSIPPAPDFNARTMRSLLRKLYPGTTGEVLIATESQLAWRTVMEQAADKAKVYDTAAEVAKTALLFDMEDAAELRFPDGKVLRRKIVERKAYTVEATKYVDARITKTKE
jgi:putative phage-type endonuclease